jgi:hypothetical protein
MALTATPQQTGLPGDWGYAGCAVDLVSGIRTSPWQTEYVGTLTANVCLGRCAEFGYTAAALGEGFECYCGDTGDMGLRGSEFVAETRCDAVCQGNSSSICGE